MNIWIGEGLMSGTKMQVKNNVPRNRAKPQQAKQRRFSKCPMFVSALRDCVEAPRTLVR
jgi:hypothetical protein